MKSHSPELLPIFPFIRGARVRALKVITEGGGDTPPDRTRRLDESGFFPGYVHAEAGELGTVVETDYPEYVTDPKTGETVERDTVPTVAFDRTCTATIVNEDEIELVEPFTLLGCERCSSYGDDGRCEYNVAAAGPGYRCMEWSGCASCGKGLS